jgi:HAD superfamily hydrolase (TIGR01549 family)
MITPGEPIQAVTLDMDGTLYNPGRASLRRFWVMLPIRDVFRDLLRVREELRGQGPFDNLRAEQARRFATRRRISEPEAARLITRVVDQEWPKTFPCLKLFRGAGKVIGELQRRKIPLGIISDFPARDKLLGLGLDPNEFQAIVVTEEIGALKPHAAPYLMAAKLLGVEPSRILHVGDREDCDVAGARAIGMKAALFSRKKGRASEAEIVFSRWGQFLGLLARAGLLPAD